MPTAIRVPIVRIASCPCGQLLSAPMSALLTKLVVLILVRGQEALRAVSAPALVLSFSMAGIAMATFFAEERRPENAHHAV